jgi:hypothetical protein
LSADDQVLRGMAGYRDPANQSPQFSLIVYELRQILDDDNSFSFRLSLVKFPSVKDPD